LLLDSYFVLQKVPDSLTLITNGADSQSIEQDHWQTVRVSSRKGASVISKAQYSPKNDKKRYDQ